MSKCRYKETRIGECIGDVIFGLQRSLAADSISRFPPLDANGKLSITYQSIESESRYVLNTMRKPCMVYVANGYAISGLGVNDPYWLILHCRQFS
jgi:hypothetical protein